MQCSLNRLYSLFMDSLVGFPFRIVLVISVGAHCAQVESLLIWLFNSSRNSSNISRSFVNWDSSISFVILTKWVSLRHHRFAPSISFFSNIGILIFLLGSWRSYRLCFFFVLGLRFRFISVWLMLTAPCCIRKVTNICCILYYHFAIVAMNAVALYLSKMIEGTGLDK